MPDVTSAAIAGGAQVFGGLMSSHSSSKAAGKAAAASERSARYQADVTWKMFEQSRQDLLPYIKAGESALGYLSQPKDKREVFTTMDGVQDWYNIDELLKAAGANAKDPQVLWTELQEAGFKTRTTPNPDYVDPTGGAEKYLQNLMDITFPDTDPTGGMQKYMEQLDALEFKFDPNDSVYKFRQQENERRVNQFMASRGGYDSRAAANMLLKSGMELEGQEIDRQFNQRYLTKYNKLVDLSKMSLGKGQAETQNALTKYTSDVSKNLTGFNAAMTLGKERQNELLAKVQAGLSASGTAGQLGSGASNQLANIFAANSNNQQNALLQQGAAQAGFWNSVGTLPGNAMMMYQLLK